MYWTVELFHGLFFQIAICIQLVENILRNNGLFLSGCSAKVVKSNLKPFVDIGVNFVILVT